MFKNIVKITALFVFGMAGGIFADQIFWPYFVNRPLFYKYRLEQAPVYVTEKNETIIQENTALKNAIEKVEKTVIGVRTKLKNGKQLEGSGIIVSSDGLALTVADLIPTDYSETSFIWEGKSLSFKILKKDLKENLVLIKLDEINLPATGFGDLSRTKIGERVFLVGIIFEKGIIPKKTVNEGIIKNFSENSIQTNISEKITLSGSPLFNIEGNLLGLNTIDQEGKIVSIPISKIRNFLGF